MKRTAVLLALVIIPLAVIIYPPYSVVVTPSSTWAYAPAATVTYNYTGATFAVWSDGTFWFDQKIADVLIDLNVARNCKTFHAALGITQEGADTPILDQKFSIPVTC